MKKLLLTLVLIIISIALNAQEPKITVKELINYGNDYFGKKVKIKTSFDGLNQGWITELPWVKGEYYSPEGLEHSYLPNEAIKWTEFYIEDTKTHDLFQLCFARKSEFKLLLDSLNDDEPIDIEGTVFDFGISNMAGLLVEKMEVEKKQNDTNTTTVTPNSKAGADSNNLKLNAYKAIGNSKNNITQIIIILFIGLIIGYFIGYKVKK